MNSATLNALIQKQNQFRKDLGQKIGMSHPTFRKCLEHPEEFTIKQMNALGKLLKTPGILAHFVRKS